MSHSITRAQQSRARNCNNTTARPTLKYSPLFTALALAFSPMIAAAPLNGQVTAGSGSITQGGSTTTITQNTQNLSLNWDSFNIGSTETVNFLQPSASSIAVNRILDTNGSQILGNLSANGQVYLINPNGILFGRDAQVNVGGLVASALNVDDASLGDATRLFSGNGTGSVNNQGSITATDGGYVALLGNNVSNQGSINAPLGNVALGAGRAATLTFANSSLVKMQIDQSTLDNLAENGGLIRADGGMVLLSAGAKDALQASVVNNTGFIEARTVENRNGTIILLGGMAAGTTNVGGTLDASAPSGGDGGFIETSAAQVNVASDAQVTTAATNGLAGNWLIDPMDFIISDVGGNIGSTALSNSLGAGNVTIQSDSGSTGSAGNIIANGEVTWAANKLTLNAWNNIYINANLHASGSASLALEYGQGAVASGNTSGYYLTNGAQVNLPAGQNFSTKQGNDVVTPTAYTVITALGADGSTTPTDLQGINSGLAGNYVLGVNIDAVTTSGWAAGFTPIGTSLNPFTGTFDGLGHTISNLTINPLTTTDVGLFGYTGTTSVVRNIQAGGTVTGATRVGILAGTNLGTIIYSYGTGAVSGATSVGGLVGSNSGTITSSYASSGVVGSATDIGGLLGNNAGTVSNSYATGRVSDTGTGTSLGGLAGSNVAAGTISDSYATGSVTGNGTGDLAGLVGNNAGTINTSYATGLVSGTGTGTNLAGLVAVNTGNVTNSYWDTTTSGQTLSATGVGLDAMQYQQHVNFIGFDFANTWIGYDGYTSPLLRTFMVPLTVTANAFITIYTGLTLGFNGVSYSATPNANLLGTLSYGGSAATAINAGSYTITPSGLYSTLQQGGYAISFVDGALTVNPAVLSVTGTIISNKVYDGTTSATVSGGTLNGVLGTDSVSLTQAGVFLSQNAGNGTAVNVTDGLGGAAAGNYTLNTSTEFLYADITPLALSVSGTTVSDKVYDSGTTATVTGGTLIGVLGSDSVSLTQSGTFTSPNVGTGIGVNVTDSLGGGAAGNYSLSTPSYSLAANITPLGISAINTRVSNKVYDGTTAATLAGGTLSGVLAADLGNLTLTQAGAFNSPNAGTGMGVTVTDSLGGSAAGNYSLNTPTELLSASITPAVLSVSGATVSNKVYDGTTAATVTGGTLIGVLGTDNVSLTQSGTFNSSNAGTGIGVNVTDSLGGSGAGNYALAATSYFLTANIDRLGLAVSGAAVSDKVYDGTTVTAVTGGTLSGVLGTDSVNLIQAGEFVTQNAGPGIVVNVTDNLGGLSAGNYTLNSPTYTMTGNITPRPVTVSGTVVSDKAYDATTAATVIGGTLNGVLGADLGKLTLSQSGSFNTQDVGNGITVTVTDSLGGTVVSNYALGTPTYSLAANITPATLTYTATPAILDLPPGVAPSGFSGTVDGFAGSDTLGSSTTGSVVWNSPATATSGQGQYSIEGSGLAAPNYVFAQTADNATALTLTRQGVSQTTSVQDQSLLLQLAQVTATQLESDVLSSPRGTQPGDISVSTTINSAVNLGMENAIPPDDDINWRVGEGGPILRIGNEDVAQADPLNRDTEGQKE